MKMADEAGKPMMETSNAGEYTSEQLDEMLEHFIEAKRVEADSALMTALKEHAEKKQTEIMGLFNTKPKSVKDLKDTYNKKIMTEEM